jgi:hypothetical protein
MHGNGLLEVAKRPERKLCSQVNQPGRAASKQRSNRLAEGKSTRSPSTPGRPPATRQAAWLNKNDCNLAQQLLAACYLLFIVTILAVFGRVQHVHEGGPPLE